MLLMKVFLKNTLEQHNYVQRTHRSDIISGGRLEEIKNNGKFENSFG